MGYMMENYLTDMKNKTVSLENIGEEPIKFDENTLIVNVFTDFRQKEPIFISTDVSADAALEIMKNRHVRCLFIMNNNQQLEGVITSKILSDHYLLEYMATHNIRSRNDVLAKDIMINKENIHAIDYEILVAKKLTIKDILQKFYDLHERHIFVTRQVGADNIKIIGLISAADISKKMHISIDVNLETLSFSNLLKHMNF